MLKQNDHPNQTLCSLLNRLDYTLVLELLIQPKLLLRTMCDF